MKVLLCFCRRSIGVALFLFVSDSIDGKIASNNRTLPCRTLNFDSQITGKRLLHHLIERKQASSVDWCLLFCLWDNNCMSVNFRQTKSSGGTHVCELNDSSEEQNQEDLTNENEFSYHGTKNPCRNNPCKGNAVCQTGFGCQGYRCVCPPGYSGEACDQDIDECVTSSPCHGKAKCTNTPGSYVCICTTGYQGNDSDCEDVDECATSSPCHAKANCTNTPGSYVCNCTTGYQGNGSHCEDMSDCRDGKPCNVDLLFPKEGITDYVICTNCTVPSLQAFTVCFWMRSIDKITKGTPFNYFATAQEISIYNYNNFRMYIQNRNRRSSLSATDGAWHHICFTWSNTAGSWQVYKDGIQNVSGVDLHTGHVIPGGGAVVLGQDQDKLGGKFDRDQSFVGSLSRVNLWDHVIPSGEISRMSRTCTADEGNVIKWADFMSGIKGEVKIVSPSSCKP